MYIIVDLHKKGTGGMKVGKKCVLCLEEQCQVQNPPPPPTEHKQKGASGVFILV